MDVQSLCNLAAKVVAKNYETRPHLYLNKDFELPADVSNLVFKKFRAETSIDSNKTAVSMAHQLKPTHVNVGRIEETDIEFLSRQDNLVALHFENFDNLLEFDHTNDYDGMPVLELILEALINEKARESMRALSIEPCILSETNWLQIVGEMLPNLEHLKLPDVIIFSNVCRLMCRSFPNLLSLDLSECSLLTFYGISKLVNLQNLKVSKMCFSSEEEFEELMKLRNLRVLNFTRNRMLGDYEDAMPHFVNCVTDLAETNPLPNLRVLDATCTDIFFSDFQSFCDILQKLEIVVLVGTNYHESSNMSSDRVKVVNCANLENSMDALQFCSREKNEIALRRIMVTILRSHLSEMKIKRMYDFEWAKEKIVLLCRVINNFSSKINISNFYYNGSVILKELCSPQIISQLDGKEIGCIIRCYFSKNQLFKRLQRGYDIIEHFFMIFAHKKFFRNCNQENLEDSITSFFDESLFLINKDEDAAFTPYAFQTLHNLFAHSKFDDTVLPYSDNLTFFIKLFGAEHLPRYPGNYLRHLKLTKTAVRDLILIGHAFVEYNMFERFDQILRRYNYNREVKTAQLEVQKEVLWTIGDMHRIRCVSSEKIQKLTNEIVYRYCAELHLVANRMNYDDYLKFSICHLISAYHNLSGGVAEKVEIIRRKMDVEFLVMEKVHEDPIEASFYRWVKRGRTMH